jgi:hypothetical protein
MSRGHGRIQRGILDLIETNPDGAWRTSDLCWTIYKRVAKAQRVAVSRALRRMTLPGTWNTVAPSGYTEYWLCDPCNLASMKIVYRGSSPSNFEPGGMHYEGVERAKRWRDASPLERIEMQIEDRIRYAAVVKRCNSATPEFTREYAERMKELQEEKAKLTTAAKAL